MSEPKLLPCPFCGCTKPPAMQSNWIGDNWLECVQCGASTRLREDGAGSAKDWNRRPPTANAEYVIDLLVASGIVSAEKVAQAREIAARAKPEHGEG